MKRRGKFIKKLAAVLSISGVAAVCIVSYFYKREGALK